MPQDLSLCLISILDTDVYWEYFSILSKLACACRFGKNRKTVEDRLPSKSSSELHKQRLEQHKRDNNSGGGGQGEPDRSVLLLTGVAVCSIHAGVRSKFVLNRKCDLYVPGGTVNIFENRLPDQRSKNNSCWRRSDSMS